MNYRLTLLVAALMFNGCVVRMRAEPHPDQPPPPPPVVLHHGVSRDQAVSIAMNVAAQRGLGAEPREVEREDRHWEVELAVWRGDRRGHMKVKVDAANGAVLKVKEKLKKDKDDDDDDDD